MIKGISRDRPPIEARTPDLKNLPRERLQAMLAAGQEILECQRVLEKAGLNLVGEVLRGQGVFYEYDHYPANDVYDPETHSQYYYHAHRGLAFEHGHFHTFLRRPGMPAGVKPVPYRGKEQWPKEDNALSHLVAISMDPYGRLLGLFTVNRWVTGDAWYRAEDAISMLERFCIDHAYPSWPVNRWLSALFILLRPHMEALLRRRDEAVAAWASTHPGGDAFEDRRLEITSRMAISIEREIARVRKILRPGQTDRLGAAGKGDAP